MDLDIESAPDKPLTRNVALASIKGLSRGFQGRPIELTDEVAAEIVRNVAAGSFLTIAAGRAGVNSDTVQQWLRRAKADELAGLDTLFVRFGVAISRAQAEAEAEAVAVLQRGGDGKYKDWRAQGWWLERRHKERWSLPKEQANQGLTLQLSNEALAALVDALRVGAARTIELEEQPQPVVVTKENVR